MQPASLALEKPLLRGWLHAVAALFAVIGLVALLVASHNDLSKLISVAVYGSALTLLFACSATYHIPSWSPRNHVFMRRVDHSMIFLCIAGTYTPLIFNVLTDPIRSTVLVAIWSCALLGISGAILGDVLAASFFRAHRQLLALPYVVMGWVAIFALAPLTAALGWTATLLVSLGGLQYSIGAFMYAFKRPQLWPATFGYHEAFHAATIVASLTFYWVIFAYAIPFHRH